MSNQNLDAIGHVVQGVNQKLGTNYGVEDLTFADVVLDDPSVVGLSTSARNSHIEARYAGGEDRGPFRMRVNYNRLRFDILFGEEPTIDVEGKLTTHDLLSELSDLATVEILASDVEDTPIDFQDPDRPVFTLTAKPLSRHYFGSVQFVGNAVVPPVIAGRRHLIAFHEDSFVTTDFTTSLEDSDIALTKPSVDSPWSGGYVGGTGLLGEYASVNYFEDDSIGRNVTIVRVMTPGGTSDRRILLTELVGEYGPSSYDVSEVWPDAQFEEFDNRVGSFSITSEADRAVWHKGYLYLLGTLDATRASNTINAVVRVRHDVTPMVVEPVLAYPDLYTIHSDGNLLAVMGSEYDQDTYMSKAAIHIASDGSDWVKHLPAMYETPPVAYGDGPLTVLSTAVNEDNGVDVDIAFGQITASGLGPSNVPSFVGPTADVIGFLQGVHGITTTVDDEELSYNYARAYLGADNTGVLVLSYYFSRYDQDTQNWTEYPISVFNVYEGGQWATTHIMSDRAPYADAQMPIYRSGDNILVAGYDFGYVDGQADTPLQIAAISTNAGNGWSTWSPPARFTQIMLDQGYDPSMWLPMAVTPMMDPPTAKVGPETVFPTPPEIGEPKALNIDRPVIFRSGGNVWVAEANNTNVAIRTNTSADTTLGVGYFGAIQAEEDGYFSTGKGLGEHSGAAFLYLADDTRFQFDSEMRKLHRLTDDGRVDTTYDGPVWNGDIYTSPIMHIEKHSSGLVFISCAEAYDYNTPLSSGASKLQLYITDADGSNVRAVDVTGASLPAGVDLDEPMVYRFMRTEELANGEVLGWVLSDTDSEYLTKSYLCRISATGVLLQMVEIEDHLARYQNNALYFSQNHNAWHVTDTTLYFVVYDNHFDGNEDVVLSEVRAYDLATLTRDPSVALNLLAYGQESISLRLMPVQTNTGRLYFVEESGSATKLYHLDVQGTEPTIVRTEEVPPYKSGYGEGAAELTSIYRDPVDNALWVTGRFDGLVFGSGEDAYPLDVYVNAPFGRSNVVKLGGSDNTVRPAIFEAGVQSPWYNTKEAMLHDRHTQVAIGVLHSTVDDADIDYDWSRVYQYGSLDLEADGSVENLAVATTTTDKISALLMRLSAISPTAPLLSFDYDSHSIDNRYPDTVNGSAKLILSYGGDTVELGLGISVDGGNNETYLYRFAEGPVNGRIDPPSYISDSISQDRALVSRAYFQISDRQIGELFGVAPGTAMDGIECWVEWNDRRVGLLFDMPHPAAPEELPFFMGAASAARLTSDFTSFRAVSNLENAPLSSTYNTSPVGTMPNRQIYTTTVNALNREVKLHWSDNKGETWNANVIPYYGDVRRNGAYFKGAYYTVLSVYDTANPGTNPVPDLELVRISRTDEDPTPRVEPVLGGRNISLGYLAADDRYLYSFSSGETVVSYSENGRDWTRQTIRAGTDAATVSAMVANDGKLYVLDASNFNGLVVRVMDVDALSDQWAATEIPAAETGGMIGITDAYLLDDKDTIIIGANVSGSSITYGALWAFKISDGSLRQIHAGTNVRSGMFLDNGRTLVYSGATLEGSAWRRRGAFTNDRDATNWTIMSNNTEITTCTNLIPVQGKTTTLPEVVDIPLPADIGRFSSSFFPIGAEVVNGVTNFGTQGKKLVWGNWTTYRTTDRGTAVASKYMAVLNADGSVDDTWVNPYAAATLNTSNAITDVKVLDDGGLVVLHGVNYAVGGVTGRVHFYNPDGTHDVARSAALATVSFTSTASNSSIQIGGGYIYLAGTITAGGVGHNLVRFALDTGERDADWFVSGIVVPRRTIVNHDGSYFLALGGSDEAYVITTERDDLVPAVYSGTPEQQATNKAGIIREGRLYANRDQAQVQNIQAFKANGKIYLTGRGLLAVPGVGASETPVLELDESFEIAGAPLDGKISIVGDYSWGDGLAFAVDTTGTWYVHTAHLKDADGQPFVSSYAKALDGTPANNSLAVVSSSGDVKTFYVGLATNVANVAHPVSKCTAITPMGDEKIAFIGNFSGLVFSLFPHNRNQPFWNWVVMDTSETP